MKPFRAGEAAHRYRYFVYGLVLESPVPLPELSAPPITAAEADLTFGFSDAPAPAADHWFAASAPSDGVRWLTCSKTGGGYLLSFPACATFVVDAAGKHVVCRGIAAGVTIETIRHLLLDQVLPMALNLRGRDALHATAVLIGGAVCAFSGPSGSGKSTLAASFLAVGYPVVADDCLVLEAGAAGLSAMPAYPGIRLEADSFAALYAQGHQSLPVAHYSTKRRVVVTQERGFPAAPCPVARIYLLNRAPQTAPPALTPVQGRTAVTELVAHLYRLDVTDRAMLRRQFALLERIGREVPIRHLTISGGFAALAAARQLILDDLANPPERKPSPRQAQDG